MASRKLPMTSDLPQDAAVVLELERQARLRGTGLTPRTLAGRWSLNTTWSRRAQAAPIASTLLLRTLKACLELEPNETNLRIANQAVSYTHLTLPTILLV